MVWIYEDPQRSPYEKEMNSILKKLLKNPDLANKGARNLGLFEFLKSNNFSSAGELRKSVLMKKGKPFFNVADSKKVHQFFNEQKGGGGEGTAFDSMVERWLNFMFYLTPKIVQDPLKMVTPFAFPLRSLEGIPGYGEVLGMSVDVAAQFNKNAAKMAQQYTPLIMGLAPIPEASTVGIIVGYMLSTMFIFFNMIIFVTRHHFGEAFTQSLALFPFVGMALENFAESGDKLVEKFSKKREKLIEQLKSSTIFAPLGSLIENYTFNPTYSGDPEQDAAAFKGKLESGFESAKAFGKDMSMKIQDPEQRTKLLKQASELHGRMASKINEHPISESVKKFSETGRQLYTDIQKPEERQALLEKAKGHFNTLKGRVNTGLTQAKKSFQGKQAGGKRLSKIRHHKGKWGTRRRSKK